jgi:hypothetical protein
MFAPSISLDIKEFFKDKHEFGGSKMFAPGISVDF